MPTPRRVTVEVTPADIERACAKDSYRCVVAQAIARTVRTATNIEVDTQSVRFTVDGERRVYLTPYAVQGYVIAFDAGEDIDPFSFQLRDPRIKRRKVLTEEGKAAQRAAGQARRAAERVRVEPTAEGSTADQNDPAEAARVAYAQARKDHPGPLTVQSGHGAPPPRVWKTKRRSYGQRLLRINRED